MLSAICPDDLGLKAGFWSTKEGDPVTFRPIVGWVTVTNWESLVGGMPFLAVVLNDFAFPVFVERLPEYIGVFAKSSTPAETRAKCGTWRSTPGPNDGGGGSSSGSTQGQAPN